MKTRILLGLSALLLSIQSFGQFAGIPQSWLSPQNKTYGSKRLFYADSVYSTNSLKLFNPFGNSVIQLDSVQFDGPNYITSNGTGINVDGVVINNGSISGTAISGNITGNAANVTGTVGVANGGTGQTSLPANSVLITVAANTVSSTASINNSMFVANGSGTPVFSTTFPSAVNVPIARVTGLQDSITAARTAPSFDKYVGADNTDGSVTGSITETILVNIAIPAGTMGANDIFEFRSMLYAVGTSSIKTFNAYLSPNNNSLTGAIKIGTLTFNSTNILAGFERTLANKNSITTNNVYTSVASSPTDDALLNTARTATNVNFGVNQWFIITCQLSAPSDLGGVDYAFTYIHKP